MEDDWAPVGQTAQPAAQPSGDFPVGPSGVTRVQIDVPKTAAPPAPADGTDDWQPVPGALTRAVAAVPAEAKDQPKDDQPKKASGIARNVTAGLNEGIYDVLGAPVDLARGAINLGVRGINYAAGTSIPTIPSDSFGGSQSIATGLGHVDPALNPANTTATTPGERIARAAGQGASMMIAPEAAVTGLGRAGVMAPELVAKAAPYVGQSTGAGSLAANATVGAASGAGQGVAQEVAPNSPTAAVVGGLGGGVVGLGVTAVPAVARAGANAVHEFVQPMTQAGRQQIAANQLKAAATDPAAAQAALANGPAVIVPGSQPTTFQQTGDMGLGALERAQAAKNPDQFAARSADQNAARVTAAQGVQQAGAPEQVAASVRAYRDALDQQTQAALDAASQKQAAAAGQAGSALSDQVTGIGSTSQGRLDAATQAAQGATAQIGLGQTPEAVGGALRGSLEAARADAKQRERALWQAVDPDGTLALSPENTVAAARQLQAEHPASAAPIAGEEAAIHNVVAQYGGAVPLSEMTALRSRIGTELRNERLANGDSPAYRRLSILNNAISDDLDHAVAGRVAEDQQAVAAGTMRPQDTVAARMSAQVKAPTTIYTPSGRAIDTNFAVMEGGNLTHSGMPSYPAELQPRDRSRAASDVQISQMAANLQPERLGAAPSAAEGSPVIGPDGVVESGNGRVQAIMRAYAQNPQAAQDYRGFLQSQGFDTAGMKSPILVRVRKTPLSPQDRVRFTQEANAPSMLGMSASEQAANDAKRLTPDLLGTFQGGDVGSAANRNFARGFLHTVAEKGQEGQFTTASGALSLDGTRRIQNALLHSAYNDGGIVASLAENGDENIRSFGSALTDIAGDVAKLKSGIAAGHIDPSADISVPLTDAARIVQNARRSGVTIADAIGQKDAFSPVSPETIEVLRAAYGPDLAGRISRTRFDDIMRAAISEAGQQSTEARLFGSATGIGDILQTARTRYAGQGQTTSFADDGANLRPSNGEGRAEAPGLGSAAPGAGAAKAGGNRIISAPQLTPNLDQAAADRLSAARQATAQRAATFDNKALGPMRARPSTNAPYNMPDATVAAKVFSPGAGGFQSVQTYRNAVGDPEALQALRDYAVDRLRNTALRPDGTLDPGKVAAFRKQYSDALRAFPDLDRQFADAATASQTMAGVAAEHHATTSFLAKLQDFALRPDGSIDPARVDKFARDNADFIAQNPRLAKSLGDVQSATDAMANAAAQRKAALDNAQKGILGQLMHLESPESVTNTVGGLFSRKDAVEQFTNLRAKIGNNADAQQGLKKSIAEYITHKFVGNSEAGTSGVGTMKSDSFQTFIKRNGAALRAAGFSDDQIATWKAIAADLQRSNRSASSVKLPGSNTAQDLTAIKKGSLGATILTKILTGAGAAGGFLHGGFVGGFIGGQIGHAVGAMRQSGLNSIDAIITDALLNPERAKALLAKADGPKAPTNTLGKLANMYGRSAVATGVRYYDQHSKQFVPQEHVDGLRAALEAKARAMAPGVGAMR